MTETSAGPARSPVPAERDSAGAPLTDLRRDGQAALEWAASYLERVSELPVLAQVAPGDIRARLPARAPDEPEPFSAVLRDLDEILLPGLTHWQHPRFFAYFATSASEAAILAELLAAALNSVAFLWRTAPAATELEGVVLDWVADLLGLPTGWHGHIEDTASTSTLAACMAAREATGRDLIVCSEQAHSAAEKAARMLGMRLRKIPVDSEFRMRADALGDVSDAAVIVATVGTTAATAVDPVGEVADVIGAGDPGEAATAGGSVSRVRMHRPWLHVDAAYAGAAMVCPECRWAFEGVDRADSLVVNAHKWMLTPMDCSLLWTRRREDFRRAFSVVPEFLRTPDAEDALNLSEYGPALGRRFRALKLWAVLRCHGRSGLQRHIRGGIALAETFEGWVAEADGWEVCAPRRFSVVCFRLEGEDERNRRLLERANAGGEMFISHATLNGRYVLRLAIGGMSTIEEDVRRAWEVLRREAARV
jgi:aromatic-L-amino-acid/L-tryptophan decarboxylase